MKQTIILAFVVTALILAYAGSDGNIFALQQNKIEQELMQLERDWCAAQVNKDLIKKLIVPAALFAVTFAIACSQSGEQQAGANQADVEAINKLREQEMAAFSAADVNTLLILFTNDAIVMPPNEPALYGKDAIRAWLENVYKQFTVQGKYTSSDVVLAGDWAFERFTSTLTTTPVAGGEPVQEVIKGLHIYRRQADGSWKIAQDIWNTDNPPDAGQ